MNRMLSSKVKASTLALLCLFCLITSVNAHELWVGTVEYENGMVRGDMGYGHDFPNCEPIAVDRLHIFEPLHLVTADGVVPLDQVGENYAYQKKMSLKKGSYLVLATYRPTFWSNGPDGWAQTDRVQRPDAVYVEEAIMCGKTVLNVQGSVDDTLVTRPAGQRLDIVPLINPAKVKAGGKLPVQVLCDGKPAAGLEVSAASDCAPDKKQPAFKGRTDDNGKIGITPLKPGLWIVRAKYAYDHPDKKRADEVVLASSLTFRIGE